MALQASSSLGNCPHVLIESEQVPVASLFKREFGIAHLEMTCSIYTILAGTVFNNCVSP